MPSNDIFARLFWWEIISIYMFDEQTESDISWSTDYMVRNIYDVSSGEWPKLY